MTRENFIEALALVESILPNVAFASIDLEFTGLGQVRPSQLDTPAMRYAAVREDAERFPPIQFGLALFCQTPTDPLQADAATPVAPHWQVTSFNFNILPRAAYYPHTTRYPHLDRIFNFQASTVQFLFAHGFDFLKLFSGGISWLLPKPEQKLREHVTKYLRRKRSAREKPARKSEDEAKQQLLARWEELITDWLSELKSAEAENAGSTGKPNVRAFVLPPFSHHRAIVFDYVRSSHPCIVASIMPGQQGSQLKLERYATEDAAREKREEILRTEVEEEVSKEVGFRLVIDAIRRLKVPIVVHNGLLDLVKLYGNFVGELPATLGEFKTAISKAFPSIYDTRWMVQQMCDKYEVVQKVVDEDKVRGLKELQRVLVAEAKKLELESNVALGTFVPTGMVERGGKRIGCAYVVKGEDASGFEVADTMSKIDDERDIYRFGRYIAGGNGEFEHEAGFDALETGRLFLLLREIKGLEAGKAFVREHGFGDMNGARNKIYLGSCGGYRYINIDVDLKDEVNVYIGTGRAVVISQAVGENVNEQTTVRPYWRIRDSLKKITEDTLFDGEKSTYVQVGPSQILAVLKAATTADGAATGEKRMWEDRLSNGTAEEELGKIINKGKENGLSITTYEDVVGQCEPDLKRRKLI